MNNLLTIQQVCKLTSLSRTTIWRLQQRDEFPECIRLSAARIAYRVNDIEAWIASRKRSVH
jgi:prophage regulatory protein